MTNTTTTRTLASFALLGAAALAFTGCAAQPAPAPAAHEGSALTVENAWVKAADTGMSAAFGELENTSGEDVTVVSVASPASTALELHETVDDGTGQMTMREIDGGFTIPAGETLTLAPGGNHIMLMDLTAPITAGDELSFTLTLDDSSTLEFTAPAKDYAGANESYSGDDDHAGHTGHSGTDDDGTDDDGTDDDGMGDDADEHSGHDHGTDGHDDADDTGTTP